MKPLLITISILFLAAMVLADNPPLTCEQQRELSEALAGANRKLIHNPTYEDHQQYLKAIEAAERQWKSCKFGNPDASGGVTK